MKTQYNLIGEHYVSLDAKGRFRLPSGLLKKLGDRENLEFVVNRGFGRNLNLYPVVVWNEMQARVDGLDPLVPENAAMQGKFYRGANELQPDSADRLLLPKQLLAFIGASKDIVLSAMGNRIEIWAQAEYEEQFVRDSESYSELAGRVFGGSSNGTES